MKSLLSSASLPVVLCCVPVGIVLGLGAYTYWYAEGASYLSNDPQACVNCHIMRDQYDSWRKASHHAVAVCNDCHSPQDLVPKYVAKAENGFWHSKGFTLQDFHEPILITPRNARILQENCIRCHSGVVGELVGHGSDPEAMVNCVRCHASVGHGPTR